MTLPAIPPHKRMKEEVKDLLGLAMRFTMNIYLADILYLKNSNINKCP